MKDAPFKTIYTSMFIWIGVGSRQAGREKKMLDLAAPFQAKRITAGRDGAGVCSVRTGSGLGVCLLLPCRQGGSDADEFRMHDRGAWFVLVVYGGAALTGPVTKELVFGDILITRFRHKWGLPVTKRQMIAVWTATHLKVECISAAGRRVLFLRALHRPVSLASLEGVRAY